MNGLAIPSQPLPLFPSCSLIPVPRIPFANPSRPISPSKPPPPHPQPTYTVCGAQMTKAAKFFSKRAARAKGTGLMRFLVNAPDVAAEAWIAPSPSPTQNRIDKATALLHRKGGQPPPRKTQFPSPTKTGNASRIATPVAGPDDLPPPIIRRQQVKPPIFYRIASVLMLLFAAGHTLGFRQNVPEWGADTVSCAHALRTLQRARLHPHLLGLLQRLRTLFVRLSCVRGGIGLAAQQSTASDIGTSTRHCLGARYLLCRSHNRELEIRLPHPDHLLRPDYLLLRLAQFQDQPEP